MHKFQRGWTKNNKNPPFSCDLAAFSADTNKISKNSLWSDEDQAQTEQNPGLKSSQKIQILNLQIIHICPLLPLLLITNPQQQSQFIILLFTKHRTQMKSHMHSRSLHKHQPHQAC